MERGAPHTVLVRREGRAGRITLNRPEALNALDLGMLRAVAAAATAWRDDPAVHLVILDSASDRAFCAGGDIRAVRAWGAAGDLPALETFFGEEYALNAAIAAYPKPWVSLIDGLCMGGGIGVSVHGSHRVATPRASFAMPETAIGMFPDVGGSFFLPRLPGAVGLWLGLTGTRLSGGDAVQAGFATHLVPTDSLPALTAALVQDGIAALAGYCAVPEPAGFAPHRAAIDSCFGEPDVPAIFAALEADGGAWARAQLATLARMSPSALTWSHRILAAGASRTLAQCLAAELVLVLKVTRHHEFHEGVRAMVIDKDRKPAWSPARLSDVDPAALP